jgi:hypothetical protein
MERTAMNGTSNTLTVAAAVAALCCIVALSPLSAGSGFEASAGYFPDQIANRGTAIETAPADSYGDFGLARSFPKEEAPVLEDGTPKLYY